MKLLLLLFSPFSRLVCRAKDILYSRGIFKAGKVSIPVFSVGNISFGGAEKTPLAMDLLAFLIRRGLKPALISRGYKGTWVKAGGVLSDGKTLFGGWRQGGDEPFMTAREFPAAGVFVGRNRIESCRKARECGFEIAILDDGFQHRRLSRDLDIVLFDPREKPALREGPSALQRADIIMVKRPIESAEKEKVKADFPGASVFEFGTEAQGVVDLRTMAVLPTASLRDRNVLAFCGIANPGRFYRLLESCGAKLSSRLTFADHYSYPTAALQTILRRFRETGAEAVVTTQKDAVKIDDDAPPLEGLPLYFLKIRLDIETAFYEAIERKIGPAGGVKDGRE